MDLYVYIHLYLFESIYFKPLFHSNFILGFMRTKTTLIWKLNLSKKCDLLTDRLWKMATCTMLPNIGRLCFVTIYFTMPILIIYFFLRSLIRWCTVVLGLTCCRPSWAGLNLPLASKVPFRILKWCLWWTTVTPTLLFVKFQVMFIIFR